MFGKGSLEDAKALQASFKRARSPRRRGGARAAQRDPNLGSRYNETRSRQVHGNGARQEPMGHRGYPQQHVNSQQYGQPQHYGQSQQYGHSQQRGHFPASHDPYVPHQQRQRPSFPPPQQRNGDLLDFNRPFPPREPVQRQENIPPQEHQPIVPVPAPAPAPASAPAHSSLLDEKEEEISQPVMQFTSKAVTPEAQKADVAMNDTDEMEKPNTPPRYGGLSASRWNTDNVSHPGRFSMDIDNDSPEEQRGGVRRESQRHRLASPGRIVTSGMLQGPGLCSSRWAPEDQYHRRTNY